jgi:phospholipid transport system substrate-binding protein
MSAGIQVVFYRIYGHVYQVAEGRAAGARDAGAGEVSGWQGPEPVGDASHPAAVNEAAGVRPRGQEKNSLGGARHRGVVRSAAAGFAGCARGSAVALALVAGLAAAPEPAAAETPAEFINTLGADALAEMRSYASPDQKVAYFRQMLREDFALSQICRFVLGPYSRSASAEQQHEFRKLMENHIMHTEAARLAQYSGGEFRVTGSRTTPAGVVVISQIITPQGQPIAVEWQLGVSDGRYKITDVAIDGASMAIDYRNEIASNIGRDGGQFATLLARLRDED